MTDKQDKILKEKFLDVVKSQNEINYKIDPNWESANYPWYLPAWKEASEILDHTGWEWWKSSHFEIEQVHLEVADIFHFALSQFIQNRRIAKKSDEEVAEDLYNEFKILKRSGDFPQRTFKPEEIHAAVETFIANTFYSKEDFMDRFFNLCVSLDIDADTLANLYICKNVLNMFRAENGYKEGTYRKIWKHPYTGEEKEDNKFLYTVIKALPSVGVADTKHTVKKVLNDIYKASA